MKTVNEIWEFLKLSLSFSVMLSIDALIITYSPWILHVFYGAMVIASETPNIWASKSNLYELTLNDNFISYLTFLILVGFL